jgi:ketosteroid isomerase-like protein
MQKVVGSNPISRFSQIPLGCREFTTSAAQHHRSWVGAKWLPVPNVPIGVAYGAPFWRDTARAMSQENVEIVRRSTDAYNRRDLDGILEHWAPDAVVDWSNSHGFDAGVYRGHGEIRAFWQRLLEAFEEVRIELVEPIEVEGGPLIVENVAYMQGRDGIEVQARSAWLITIRDGETTSLTLYQTKQEALEAAGLSE